MDKVKKAAKYIAIAYLMAVALITVMLSLPPVQTFLARKATMLLADKTGAHFSIGKVAICLPDKVSLNEICLKDLQNDTVLYAGKLRINVSLITLLRKRIAIDYVLLQDAAVNVIQNKGDRKFNFQFLIDAFAGGKPAVKDSAAGAWAFSVNSAELKNVRTHIDLPDVEINASIGEFSAETNSLDLKRQVMNFEHVTLKNSTVAVALPKRETKETVISDSSGQKLVYIMPDIGWSIKADEIEFADNNISFDDNDREPQHHGVDYVHLAAKDFNLQIKDASYIGHVLAAKVEHLSLYEKSGARLRYFSGSFRIDENSIRLNKLDVALNRSHLSITKPAVLQFPDLDALTKFSEEVNIDVSLNKSHVAPEDFLLFVPQLSAFESVNLRAVDSIYLDGSVSGTVGNFTINNFTCALDKDALLNFTMNAEGLPDTARAVFAINIDRFSAQPAVISSLANIVLPDEAMRLGEIELKGKCTGTIHKLHFDGEILTQAGAISPNLAVAFNKDYTDASYNGEIKLKKFQLGKMLGAPSIGAVSLQAAVNGAGLSADKLTADFKTEIGEAIFRNYSYQNISAEGNFDRKKITASVVVKDNNLKCNFSGTVDMRDSVPSFGFRASLDTTNLCTLALTTENFFIGAEIEGKFSASSLDNFRGGAAVRKLHFGNDSLHASLDSVVLSVWDKGSGRIFKLESPIVHATLDGRFSIAGLPGLLTEYLSNYFPVEGNTKNTEPVSPQRFRWAAKVSRPLDAIRVFIPQISKLDSASVSGSFDSEAHFFELNANLPGIVCDSVKTGSGFIRSSANKDTLNFSAIINDVNYSNKAHVRQAMLNVSARDKAMLAALTVDSDSVRRLGLTTEITMQQKNVFNVRLLDDLTLNDERWQVSSDNYVRYRNKFLNVNHLAISEGNQKISISSPQDSSGSVRITFANFNLREISDMAGFASLNMDGIINGTLSLNDIFTSPSFTADLSVNEIVVNKNIIGNLSLKALQQGEDVSINAELDGSENDLLIAGKIFPQNGTMDMDVNMKRLNLKAADPFLKDFIQQSEGYFSASLKAEGKFTQPSVNGSISLHGISTHAIYPNARYVFADNTIDVSSHRITVNRLEVFDEQKRIMTLDGFLTHNNFSDVQFDLTLKSDDFLFMNTGKQKDYLYGTILLGVNAHLTGTPESPVVDAKVLTRPGTKVFVLPGAQQENISQEDFVLFKAPPFYDAVDDTLLPEQRQYKSRASGIDLHLAFQLTPDAELQIIVDPYAGDKLTCKGTANLSVHIPPAGVPQVNGSYIVESGDYSFSYQRLLKKNFQIKQGSRIDFSGDIMDALLDIRAVYTAKASSYELIAAESASLSSSEIAAAKKKVPVDVLLTIRGDIAQPELTYDVRFPENTGNATSSAAERKLMQLRQDQAELSKQVFALLLFNSFIADYNTGGTDWGAAAANTALQSVSSMITAQLNKLSHFSEGLEVNLDLTSYNEQLGNNSTGDNVMEMGFDISHQFLNDRLEVTVGGNVNLDNSASGQSGGVSNFTGDFAIEYKLTENGKYRVKVFRTGNYDMVNQSNIYRTGVGFTYRHSFKDVLGNRKKRKDAQHEK